MSDRFDDLLKASAAETPDPGEYRRLNRAALRDHISHPRTGPIHRHRLIVVTACIGIMILFSGQTSQLGSDDFEMEITEGRNALGEKTTIFKDTFTGSTWVGNLSEEKIQELDQAYKSHQGEPSRLTGLTYQGKECWTFYRTIVNKQGVREEVPADPPPGYDCDEMQDNIRFYRTYFNDLRDRAEYLPPTNQYRVALYEVEFLVKEWTKSYPHYGEVTYSRGTPTS